MIVIIILLLRLPRLVKLFRDLYKLLLFMFHLPFLILLDYIYLIFEDF